MKKAKILFCLTALFTIVFFNQSTKAQDEGKKEVVIEKIMIDKDGNKVTKTIKKEGDKVISVDVRKDGDFEMEADEIHFSGDQIDVEHVDGKVIIRNVKGDELEERVIDLKDIQSDIEWKEGKNVIISTAPRDFDDGIACDRPFLGVMIEDHHSGLFVKDVFATTGADQAGLQLGDIITEIDGVPLENIPVLSRHLSEREAGATVNLTVLRNDEVINTSAVLQDRETNDAWIGKYKKYWIAIRDRVDESETREKAFMGVFLHDNENGVVVSGTGEDGPSRSAGIQSQDILKSIGGESVSTSEDVSKVLTGFEPGQTVEVEVERNGSLQTVSVTLGGKEMHRINWTGCDEQEEVEEEAMQEIEKTFVIITKDIPEPPEPPTPPGPPAPPPPPEAPSPEPAEATNDMMSAQVSEDIFAENFELELEDVSVFPNPTSDFVNVSFRASNEPIRVTIVDALGREIYDQEIDRFEGYFADQIDLSRASTGAAILTVQQGNKKFSKQIIRSN